MKLPPLTVEECAFIGNSTKDILNRGRNTGKGKALKIYGPITCLVIKDSDESCVDPKVVPLGSNKVQRAHKRSTL